MSERSSVGSLRKTQAYGRQVYDGTVMGERPVDIHSCTLDAADLSSRVVAQTFTVHGSPGGDVGFELQPNFVSPRSLFNLYHTSAVFKSMRVRNRVLKIVVSFINLALCVLCTGT
jgi:hypothetical protein